MNENKTGLFLKGFLTNPFTMQNLSLIRILQDKNPVLSNGYMDIVVANKKEDDQLYYHSCGELCCSGWGATPELQNNNSKIILATPTNKIIVRSAKSVQKTYKHRGILICCFKLQKISSVYPHLLLRSPKFFLPHWEPVHGIIPV